MKAVSFIQDLLLAIAIGFALAIVLADWATEDDLAALPEVRGES